MAVGDFNIAELTSSSNSLTPPNNSWYLVRRIGAALVNNVNVSIRRTGGAQATILAGTRTGALVPETSELFSLGEYYLLGAIGGRTYQLSANITGLEQGYAIVEYEEVQLGSGVGQYVAGGLHTNPYTLRPAAGQQWRILAAVSPTAGYPRQLVGPSRYVQASVGCLVDRSHQVQAGTSGYIAAVRTK